MDENSIPEGLYCYDDSGRCPYWDLKAELPYQENGYCAYLNKSDWDLNEEQGNVELFKGGQSIGFESAHNLKCSLLWDSVKECGINETTHD